MILSWSENGWDDYLYWLSIDKTKLNRINLLIKDILRHPDEGIGDPEPLKHHWSGYWSRRIDREHRIAYKVAEDTLCNADFIINYEIRDL